MFEKEFETFAKRHKELSESLADPNVFSDQERYKKLNREYSQVSKVHDVLTEYRRVASEAQEAKQLMNEAADAEMAELAQMEHEELESQLPELHQKVLEALVPPDPDDEKNAILEIRAGTGGDEAAIFAGDLYRMYTRYTEKNNLGYEILEAAEGEAGGYKEVIILVKGSGAYGLMRHESGTHRVQRVPATESGGRIHTSAATVAVLPEVEEQEVHIAENDLKIDVFRSSGPGGQSVNTTDSAVRITHIPTGIIVSCQDEKSQHKNKAKALMVMRARLTAAAKAEADAILSAERKSQVGTGDRSEKIRTYNYPQNRVTDHRIGLTKNALPQIMDGDLDEFLEQLSIWRRRLQVEDALGEQEKASADG